MWPQGRNIRTMAAQWRVLVKSFGDALPAGPSPRARCPKAIDARAGGHWQQFLTGEFLTDKRIKRYRGNKLPITTSNRESYNMNAVLGEIPNGHFRKKSLCEIVE